ncbi:hypothetical protein GCM10027093_21280 [Paraburkholderia jirisanensis]
MTDRQQIFAVGVAGATNLTLPTIDVREIRGDGLYIGQSNWTASSANPSNIKIGRVTAINSDNDGRNAISIISGTTIYIEYLLSIQIGALVAGFIQPGGLDIEPDFGYEACTGIRVGICDITTAGSSGLGVFGKSISGNDANLDWNCFDIQIGMARVSKVGTTGSSISAQPFTRVSALHIDDLYVTYDGGVRGRGPMFDFCQRVIANVRVANVNIGALVGSSANADGCEINVVGSDFDTAIVRTTSVTNSKISVRRNGQAIPGSTAFGVQLFNEGRSIAQQDVTYSVHCTFDTVLARAFRNEPGNLVAVGTGCQVNGGDWTGYPSGLANDAAIPAINVKGWNDQTSIPIAGTWMFGDFVRNTQPVQSAGKIMIGWSRLNTGSNNVLNNDWSQVFATIL